jgi:hypothetical protein
MLRGIDKVHTEMVLIVSLPFFIEVSWNALEWLYLF